ncbi:MAG: fatty acid desaturase [Gammaproteobacteria bacterium HGW-Gammaproteobacteria-8]|nr:MAG: fatty acid desaturase [Gammaproteobacteria bacterium HGW-Gammaproteobacteria-8]
MQSGPVTAAEERDQLLQARALVDDLFARRPALYWLDFGLTSVLTWGAIAIYFSAPLGSPTQITAMLIAAIGLFRGGTFIHEIVHFRHNEMTAFKWAWNLLLGFPVLSPWVLYRNHIEHHSRQQFGTPADGEYLPLAASPPRETVKYLLQVPLLPLLAVLRFGILGPISYLSSRWREWLLTRASAAVTNPYYRNRFPERFESELVRSEAFCMIWLLTLALLTAFGPIEAVHWLMAWALLALAVGMNWLRNLAAHGYANDGQSRTYLQQLEDSINLTGQTWLTSWFFPVGLRYHALHHLLPGLPYHALGEAHRRLMRQLPESHPYRRCNKDNYFQVVGKLLARAWSRRGDDRVIKHWRSEHHAE